MNRAYRFRIYPNKEQQILLMKTFGCCRFIYNQMLHDKMEAYEKNQKMLRTTPAMYKKQYPWLAEVDSLALANVQLHLERAYKNFFREPKVGYPRYKSKHSSQRSYTTNLVNGNICLDKGKLKLPKVGLVTIRQHREIPSDYRLKAVTVTREPCGDYYASVLFVCESQAVKEKEAKSHAKIRNQRKDFQHKPSHQISEAYDAVGLETLDMKGMSQGLHLGKGVMDNGYGMFVAKLEYKLKEKGKRLIYVDRFYPSSKTCSVCGRVKEKLPLSERTFICECGNHMDRDINAAVNIREEAIRILSEISKCA